MPRRDPRLLGLLVLSLCLHGCRNPHVESFHIDESTPHGWVAIEFGVASCAENKRYDVRIPPSGYTCVQGELRDGMYVERFYLARSDGSETRLNVGTWIRARSVVASNGPSCNVRAVVFWYGPPGQPATGDPWRVINSRHPGCDWTRRVHDSP